MRISLRRSGAPAARPADGDGAEPAAVAGPPRGLPVAAYAAVLDGRHLWLAVHATPGTIALRDAVSGDVITPAGDHEDSPTYRSVRADLLALPGAGEATYDAVVVPPGGRSPKRVWTPPLPAPGGTIVPPTPDGGHRFALDRSDDGSLRVIRRVEEALPELVAVTSSDEAIELRLSVATGELELCHEDGVLLSLPLVDGRAVLRLADLPADTTAVHRVTIDGRLVRRRRNALATPGSAVLLPTLHEPEVERARVRLAWSPRGTLNVRFPAAESGA